MSTLRKVERLVSSKWETVRMKDIKKGDIYRMFENNETISQNTYKKYT